MFHENIKREEKLCILAVLNMFEQTMNVSVPKGIAIAQMQWMWHGESNTLKINVTKVNGEHVKTCAGNHFAWKCEQAAHLKVTWKATEDHLEINSLGPILIFFF